jgi:hypothetical protein
MLLNASSPDLLNATEFNAVASLGRLIRLMRKSAMIRQNPRHPQLARL